MVSVPARLSSSPLKFLKLPSRSARTLWITPCIVCVLFASLLLEAQAPGPQGLLPFQSLEGGDLDNISMEDGHLFLRIPLISYPQRGGAMKLSYSLMSNNYGWATVPNGQNAWKWEPFYPTLSSFYPTEDHFLSLGLTGNCKSELWSAYVTTADNVKHPAAVTSGNLNSVTCQSYSAVTLETIDGSGFQIYSADPNNSAQTFTDRSGVVWNRSTGTRTDANGNEITSTLSGSGSVSDTLGRTVPGLPSPGNANGNSTTTNYTGCGPLTVTSAVLWKVLGPDGGTSTFKFCYANITIATDFGVANTSEYSGTINMLESVVLPNGTAWTFYYDNYGDVVEVKFPTGGYLSYTYSNLVFPFCYNDQTGSQVWTEPTVHYRKVYDGTNTNTWTYSWGASGQYNPGSTVAATSTDPDLPPISVHVRIRQLSAAPSSV